MPIWTAENWKDYELIDTSDGERLERWGEYTLIRPDPQVIWKNMKNHRLWKNPDATYKRSESGGGSWNKNTLPEKWEISYGELRFIVRPTGFKHTGLFPEQAANWDWFSQLIRRRCEAMPDVRPKVLNLFAYTGGATAAAAKAGAAVCHVDAAKGMVNQARENLALSGLADAPVRYIVDDCKKFVERELRRGSFYEGIIMDPPSYGRGPGGEVWKLEDNIGEFISLAAKLLSDKPLFFLVNSYTTGLSPMAVEYIVDEVVTKAKGGHAVAQEIGLPVTVTGGVLPCGSSVRWACE